MVQDKSGNNGEASVLQIAELVISWDGKNYNLSRDSVLEAYNKAGYGNLSGRHARYFIKINGDMKNLDSVLHEIIPVPSDDFTPDQARLVRDIFEALGFEVLDRYRHHEL